MVECNQYWLPWRVTSENITSLAFVDFNLPVAISILLSL